MAALLVSVDFKVIIFALPAWGSHTLMFYAWHILGYLVEIIEAIKPASALQLSNIYSFSAQQTALLTLSTAGCGQSSTVIASTIITWNCWSGDDSVLEGGRPLLCKFFLHTQVLCYFGYSRTLSLWLQFFAFQQSLLSLALVLGHFLKLKSFNITLTWLARVSNCLMFFGVCESLAIWTDT